MVSKKKTKNESDQKTSKSLREIEASIYFFQWTSTSLDAYANAVRALYLKPLSEHCYKRPMAEDEKKTKADPGAMAAKKDTDSIMTRLKVAATRMTHWEGEPVDSDQMISLAEMAAVYRLKTLLKMCTELVELMGHIQKWFDKNVNFLKKHAASLGILQYVLTMFEAVCGVGEVFELTSIDRSTCEVDFHLQEYYEFKSMLTQRADDYKRDKNSELAILQPQEYVPKLETSINYFRALVYVMCTSVLSILQGVQVQALLPQEMLDVRARNVKAVLELLPPQYMFASERTLSKATSKLVANPPRNLINFPLVPKALLEKSKKEVSVSRKSNASRKKFENPMDEKSAPKQQRSSKRSKSSKRSRRSTKSNKSTKSDRKEQKKK